MGGMKNYGWLTETCAHFGSHFFLRHVVVVVEVLEVGEERQDVTQRGD